MFLNSGLKKILAGSVLLLMVLLLVVLVCEEAEARAGGGHRYSGGSRPSSSRPSSSSGSSWRSSGSSRSSRSGGGAPADPFVIFIVIVVALVVFAIKFYIANSDNVPTILKMFVGVDRDMVSTIRQASNLPPSQTKKASLAPVKAKDPGFDEVVFVNRARNAFAVIQQAWTDRNLEKAEAFLSDGIYEQFSIQLGEMRQTGVIDHLENLQIKNAYPVGLQTDKNFDVIHLRIDARAVNYRKDEKTGKILDGSRAPESFSEIWSLLRKPGAKTSGKGGLMEGQCPNCGNPIKMGRLSKCDICNALLRSGEYDWVLTSITQACEWAIRPQPAVPGMNELVQSDPGFNMQHLKERASVIFWRKVETERTGKIEFLRKVALDEFAASQSNWLKVDNAGARRFYTSCAVGIINLLGIDLDEAKDTAMVEIVWSGIPSTEIAGKVMPAPGAEPINQKNVFMLVRRHGAQTKLESSLASAHCPSCGAPEQTGTANECPYCGAVMNDGKIEWVLESVCDRSDERVVRMLAKVKSAQKDTGPAAGTAGSSSGAATGGIASEISGVELMRYTIAMMLADGKIDPKELEMLKTLAGRVDMNERQLQPIVTELKTVSDAVQHVIDTSQKGPDMGLLRQLARVALADGNVSPEETIMLKKVGQRIGMTDFDIDQLIKQERGQMYQEAKELLKNQKKNA